MAILVKTDKRRVYITLASLMMFYVCSFHDNHKFSVYVYPFSDKLVLVSLFQLQFISFSKRVAGLRQKDLD